MQEENKKTIEECFQQMQEEMEKKKKDFERRYEEKLNQKKVWFLIFFSFHSKEGEQYSRYMQTCVIWIFMKII